MIESEILQVVESIIDREGGYVVDHAGPTKYGITLPAYKEYRKSEVSAKDIKSIDKQEAINFYTYLIKEYNIELIENYKLMDLVFDSCVNHGKERTVKWIQEILDVETDGLMGRITLGEMNSNSNYVYYNLVSKRVKFYTQLAIKNPNKYSKFLTGWINRICQFVVGI